MPLSQCAFIRGDCRGDLDGFDALSFEDGVEGLGVLPAPVTDHKAQRLEAHTHVKSEVAGHLGLRGATA
ncbi:hypothetical protein [Streptomyces sp. NA02950]|uniref:hypothetical protein n=1 Tax=Streptomyces sp. NA02950 TaxID=2742137 RepID=UPI001C37D5ED|nr:hypothetical protein [Streptomyces sp. NA02950]